MRTCDTMFTGAGLCVVDTNQRLALAAPGL